MAKCVLLGGLVAFLAWLALITQGAHFGMHVVRFFYDCGAWLYDAAKDNRASDEEPLIVAPLLARLPVDRPWCLLDVATGTGRLPLLLAGDRRQEAGGRNVVGGGFLCGVDFSSQMLARARRKLAGSGTQLFRASANGLPYADKSFDAVCCLEALELLPDRVAALGEMCRILKPGGTLLLTNRVGPTAPLMPGRVWSDDELVAVVHRLGFDNVHIWGSKSYWSIEFYHFMLARRALF
jgi:ubiquinone/menaquinone biosynthesis C-methylase UbiE